MSITYYEILGVSKDGTQDDIEKAYRRTMRRHHPDVHGDQQDPIPRIVNRAYSILRNPKARREYDKNLNGFGRTQRSGSSSASNNESSGECVQKTVVNCPECKGKGWFFFGASRCRRCNGKGQLIQLMPPRGRKFCSECRGHGEVEDSIAGFAGIFQKCGVCKGNGLKPTGDKIQCKKCHGSGFDQVLGVGRECHYCDGKGWVSGPRKF